MSIVKLLFISLAGWQKNEFLQLFLRVLEPSELYFLSGLLAVSLK